jgi:hypothetical protein
MKLDNTFHKVIKNDQEEDQKYWYDHPIHIGRKAEKNEIIYGLMHLEKSLSGEVAC